MEKNQLVLQKIKNLVPDIEFNKKFDEETKQLSTFPDTKIITNKPKK